MQILNKGGSLHIFMQKGIYKPNFVFLKLLLFSFFGVKAAATTEAAAVTSFLE